MVSLLFKIKVEGIMRKLIGISMFSSAGIGETYLDRVGIQIVGANELIPKRANLYRSLYPNSTMVEGDILDERVFQQYLDKTPGKVDFLLASPPCQGMSVAGKNRNVESMKQDARNYLFVKVLEVIKLKNPDIILIENVPSLLKLELEYKGESLNILSILEKEYGEIYNIDASIINAASLGVAQNRKRAIIKLYKHGINWPWPENEPTVSVKEVIGHLPNLEAGEKSNLKWHFARNHDKRHVLWMKHTPTGMSAFENEIYYPCKEDGTRIKGYNTTYRRILWDEPAPTITIRNDAISSQKNVHPGHLQADGTYSNARVLTPLEIMLLNSLPSDWGIPDDTQEILIRQCIGESIPPLMLEKLLRGIEYDGKIKS